MSDFWNIETQEESSDQILDYMRALTEELNNITNGAVQAVFIEKRIPTMQKIANATNMFNKVSNAKDASSLYHKEYEFFITDCSHRYEMQIFMLQWNAVYPVKLEIDSDIAEEAGQKSKEVVFTAEDFEKICKACINTHKVKYVIKKLLELPCESETDEGSSEEDEC